MTLRSRLLLTLSGIILLLVLPAIYGLVQLRRLSDMAEQLESPHAEDIMAVGNLRAHLAEFNRYERSYVADPLFAAHREGAQSALTLMRDQLRLLAQNYPQSSRQAILLVDSISNATDRVNALIEAGATQAATDQLEVQVGPLITSMSAAIDEIVGALHARGAEQVRAAQRVSAAAAQTTMLGVLIALFLTIVLAIWTTDALTRPLRRLSEATGPVADGDFMAPEDLPYERTDEIGHLSRSFGTMTHRLAELDRLKAEFVSLASHELKTPINVIAGYTELLSEGLYGDLEARQADVLHLVQEQTRALTRLVNQLLDLSKFEAGGLRMEPEPVDFSDLLHQVEGSFRALATQKRIDFTVDVDPTVPETVTVDPDRVRHEVLGNLLSNAFKFTSTGGEVSVRAWSKNGHVHVEVSDTGSGIPEDQLAHIFEKYYQVGADAKAKGSGLGLAIAKHVMEAHGGAIEASSVEGEGTTFRLALPHEPGGAEAHAGEPG